VSTDKQADRGVSLDAQRAKVKAYAELYDLDSADVIVDAGESAKSLDRPGLQRALAMLKAGEADALLVVKLDRLTRSVVDLGSLVERYFAPGKAALLSVGEQIDTRSAAGRLVLNVLASVSQWEREAIGERTATAMQHKARQGEYTGGQAPYGRRIGPDGAQLERLRGRGGCARRSPPASCTGPVAARRGRRAARARDPEPNGSGIRSGAGEEDGGVEPLAAKLRVRPSQGRSFPDAREERARCLTRPLSTSLPSHCWPYRD
jgi:DNA invertase Pin-like site-specific DNA recombinase